MIQVHSDLFDITSRLREIDTNYKVFYNPIKSKFELHIQEENKVSYLLTFPFDKLDARAIWHCYRTRAERKEELLKEIERSNAELEKENIYKTKKEMESKVEQALGKLC